MRDVAERLKRAAHILFSHVTTFVFNTQHNPLRDHATLVLEADYAERALKALADIVTIRPFQKYVWNVDQYRGETMTLIDARQIKDIITHHRLMEG